MVIYFSGFIILILCLLALDLGVLNKKDKSMNVKQALSWTAFWVVLALIFNCFIYIFYEHHWLNIGIDENMNGVEASLAFFTAFIVEKSLSIDNIFVIAMIFSYFSVPSVYQHRVLFWGILGALVMRGLMIMAGIAAITKFAWLTYALGALLIFTALKMMFTSHEQMKLEKNFMVRFLEKFFIVTKNFHGHDFIVTINGKLAVTPLFLALIIIEMTDLLFAVDSIPAVLAITLDPFIVFTSNVFAILGMRSLYFALSALMDRFYYLKTSLIFVLGFVGLKMILANYLHINQIASLLIIITILLIGTLASLIRGNLAIENKINHYSKITVKSVKKIFFIVSGSTVISVGIIMLILPGPGVLVIIFGLTLLAVEFVWARVWISKIKNSINELQKNAKSFLNIEKK